MKKILILAPFYPPNIGGAETFAEGLAKYLSKDHDVTVLAFKSFRGVGGDYEIVNDNLRVMRMDWAIKVGKAWSGIGIKNAFRIIPKMLLNAWQLQEQRKFDIVICNGLNTAFIGAILKVFFKVRVGCVLLALYEWKGLLGILAKRVLEKMDKIYVEGENGERNLDSLNLIHAQINWSETKAGLKEPEIIRFNHWVDQEVFKPYEPIDEKFYEYAKKNYWKVRVLFVGRPIFEKGINIIKDVERALKGEVHFEYIENVPYKEMPKHYQMADVLVVPSIYDEGFVRVVAEASSCGCAVITSNMGSLLEMVKDFGWAVQPRADHFDWTISCLNKNRDLLRSQQESALKYAKENFSEKNAEVFMSICS